MNRHFKLKPSLYLAVMLLVAHGTFLFVLPMLDLPLWSRLMLAAVVLFSLAYHLWRDAWLKMPDSCMGLVLEGQEVVVMLRSHVLLRGSIARGSLITPCLTVLNVALPERGGMHRVIVLQDSLDPEAFRQLRVWLKWGVQDVV